MPHVLHLVKDPTDARARDVIAEQARDPEVRLSVVLIQDAAGADDTLPGEVHRLVEGGDAASVTGPHRSITTSELLDLIFAADSVVTW